MSGVEGEDINVLPSLIRVFPWNNGIPLWQGAMTDQLLDWWGISDTPVEGIDTALIVVRPPHLSNVPLLSETFSGPRCITGHVRVLRQHTLRSSDSNGSRSLGNAGL
jgi:hypothetical protein